MYTDLNSVKVFLMGQMYRIVYTNSIILLMWPPTSDIHNKHVYVC